MYPRWPVSLAVVLCAIVATTRASAWQDAHQTGGDVEIHIDPAGGASVRDVLRWHVAKGPLHWIDLANIDPTAVVDPAVVVASEDGRTLTAHAAWRDANVVRVEVDDPRSFAKGNFRFDVTWRVDALKTNVLVRDGASWRLSWASPPAADGFELARTTIEVPAARQAPFAIFADTGSVDPGALSTLRRGPESDVLELVRPHVARGESVVWTVRLDPGALSAVADPHVRPVADPRPAPEPDRVRGTLFAALLALLALSFGALVERKVRTFGAACAARGARARGLLPLPDRLRAPAAGALFALGVGLQATHSLTVGSALVAAALVAAALRPPLARYAARGPGRWLALRPDEAFGSAVDPGDWLDGGTRAGRLGAAVAALLVAGLAVAARRFDAHAPWIVLLDASVLVPLFATGRVSDLGPAGARASAPWLAAVFAQLRAMTSLRVAPWARVVTGGSTVDELRLLVLPRVVMPGVVGVEIGRAWSTTPAGWTATPEVLVRVLDGSSAAAKLAQVLPRARALPGRRADERVLRLRPRAGTRAGTLALTRGLADALTDRRAPANATNTRAQTPSWDGAIERRTVRATPPPARRAPGPVVVPGSPHASTPMATSKAC